MIVVSDTSPLISFLKINRLDILEKLFGKIIVPEAVYAELVNNYEFSTETQIIRQNNFIEPVEISRRDNVLQIQNETGLDLGESEAIFLTHNLNADVLLVDEEKGRLVAKKFGLNIMGTIGVLKTAFDENIVSRIEIEYFVDVLRSSHRYIGKDLYSWLLEKTV